MSRAVKKDKNRFMEPHEEWIFSILKAEEVDPFIFPGQPLLCALAGMDVVMCFYLLGILLPPRLPR